jgi:hypothetical protein
METGLTGTGTTTTSPEIYVNTISLLTDQFTLNEVIEGNCALDCEPETEYRLSLHQVNRARVVSATVYEEPRTLLDTTVDTITVDTTKFLQGGPITQQQYRQLMLAAEKVWSCGQPLLQWTADVATGGSNASYQPRTRTSATQANVQDQSYTASNTSAPGYFTVVPYSGTLDSSVVPAVAWCYASCPSGTGTVTFRDQDNTVLATISPSGSAAWYAVPASLTDASGTETTKIDVLFAGDGANTTTIYAFGMYLAGDLATPSEYASYTVSAQDAGLSIA